MFYRWPCGMFEDHGVDGRWCVMRYRPTPSTPQGELILDGIATKEDADEIAERLNAGVPVAVIEAERA